jgi:hypothetical protein
MRTRLNKLGWVAAIFAFGSIFVCGLESSIFSPAWAASGSDGVSMLPMNCSELLPDTSPYLSFFESVARAAVTKDRKFSRRLYRILSLRDKFAESPERGREQNPVDILVRRTLCFYREQKAPTSPVSFDDPGIVAFLKVSISELETKVKQSLYQVELDRQQRREYERRLKQNQGLVDNIQRQADDEADRTFDQMAKSAKKKARSQ